MFNTLNLIKDIKSIGLGKGDTIFIHGSLRNVGMTENGAHTLIDAIQEVIGDQGTIVAQTHSMNYMGYTNHPFDVENSPGINSGIIAETLRKRNDSHRSSHPTHSSAAIGKNAKWLTQDHCLYDPFSVDSPIYRGYTVNAKILLIGVGNEKNTMIHLAEGLMDLPYNSITYNESWSNYAHYLDGKGEVVKILQTKFPGHSGAFNRLEGIFFLEGLTQYGMVGNAVTMLMESNKIVNKTMEVLKHKPEFLLCANVNCACCPRRKEKLKNYLKFKI